MSEHQDEYSITRMCHILEVSMSGYYAWCKRLPSKHSREDAQVADEVQGAFHANRCVYGSPRIHAELRAQGRRCGRKRIARLMRERQLSAHLPRHRTITTKSEKGARVAENLLQRNFHADEPNRKWVTDTTYIWTWEGWLYLSVVLDLFSRLVIGWAMQASQDAILALAGIANGTRSSASTSRAPTSFRSRKHLHE